MKTESTAKGKHASDGSKVIPGDQDTPAKSNSRVGKKRRNPSNLEFANIIEKINEGFLALDGQMNYVYVNRRGSELLERKPEDLIGKNYWAEYPQDKETPFGKAYLQAWESQTPIELEDYYAPRGLWFENRIYPSQAGLSIFFNDITERKQAEERLRLATEAAEIYAWELDLKTQNYTVADNFAQILGFSADFLPKTLSEMLRAMSPAEDVQVFLKTVQKAIENRTDLRNLQHRMINPETGQSVWLEVNAKILYDQNGNAEQMFGVAQNITESKQTESYIHYLNSELKARLDEMNVLMNILPTGVWIGNHDCSEITGNPAAYQMLGLEAGINASLTNSEPQTPTGLRIFVNDVEVSPENAPMQVVARSGKPWHGFEHELLFPNGTRKAIYGNIVPLFDEAGQVRKVIASYTDFTEFKKAESRLAFLAEFGELTRKIDDPDELLYAVAKAIGEYLRVRRCLFNETDVENDREIVYRDYFNGVESAAGVHKLSDYSNITSAEMQAGKTVVNTDSKIDPRTAQDYERTYAPNRERAYVAVPIIRAGSWVGTLWTSDDMPRQWSKEEVALLETVAERTWLTMEKLRGEEKLRASESLYRTIARSIPGGGVYVVDKDMRYIVAEGPVTQAFGLSREMLEGHTVAEVFPPDIAKRMEERLRRNFAGETVSFETAFNERVYWTQQAPLLDSIGQAIIITLDITERKLAEEALRQSEERFARFMQHFPGLAWIKDTEGRYIFANAAAEKAFNTPLEKLYGKTDYDIFPSETATQFRLNDDLALQEGKGLQLVESLQHEDGILHHSLVNKFTIPGPDGQTTLIGGTAVDITERMQAEAELRHSEERERMRAAQLETIMETVPAAIWIAHDSECRFVTGNRASYEILQIPIGINASLSAPDGISQKKFEVLHEGNVLQPDELPVQRAARGDEVHNFEEEVRFEDGTSIYLFGNAITLRDSQNNPSGALAAFIDITDRKRAEEKLHQLNLELESRVERRTTQLQAANRALNEGRRRLQILSQRLVEVQEEERRAIAQELHDRVGQSLAALNINLTVISNQLLDQVDDKINSRLSDSIHLVTEVIALVRDVMANLRPAVLDDYGLEVAIQTNLGELTARYGIKVNFQKPTAAFPRLNPSVEMTLLRITQEALLNIVRHAHADQATLSLQIEDETVHLNIHDNGLGIQSWQDANRPGSHGLMIMRERAEAVGGTFRVSSTAGKGTKIDVIIPLQSRFDKETH